MTATKSKLKAPFPYFGGKSKAADLVWDRLGNPDNYVEPFAGTLAVLLRRPESGRIETVNDRNHYLVNFWRSVQKSPRAVARYADQPVSEADLHARHSFLVNSEQASEFRASLIEDPEFYDVRFAGWWVWGQCCWIGGGWCDNYGSTKDGGRKKQSPSVVRKGVVRQSKQIPDLAGDAGAFGGVSASAGHNKRPILATDRETRGAVTMGSPVSKSPHLDARGEQRGVASYGRPQLGDAYDIGRGVNSNRYAGTCRERRQWLVNWMNRLSDRLRLVRVCYGDWHRICDSKTTMDRLGTTGAFLDPPYAKNIERVQALIRGESPDSADSTNRANELYAGDKDQDIDQLVADVNLWCQRWGAKDTVRIVLCGYEGEHDNLQELGWEVVSWKAHGGYVNRNSDNANKNRERLWVSPGCLTEPSLF